MELTIAEQIMYSTLQIEMLDKGQKTIGYASGFVFDFGKNEDADSSLRALVTNRHVLGECDYIKVFFTGATTDGEPDNCSTIQKIICTDSTIFHPNCSIDLAILPLKRVLEEIDDSDCDVYGKSIPINLIPSTDEWKMFNAIEDVIMVGYPRGLRDETNNLPIFRKGITATHPSFDFHGTPSFMVDMACFKGSSGSPVFILNEAGYLDKTNSQYRFGQWRLFLLGVQFGVPKLTDDGELVITQSDETKIVPRMPLYINLGVIVKSTELKAFEPIILTQINAETGK